MHGEHLYRIDNNGFPTDFITVYFDEEGKLLTSIEDDIIKCIIPQGIYRPKWTGEKWIEDMTQEEIDELKKSQIKEPTEIDLLKQEKEILAQSVYDLTTIVELILTGGITE